MKDHKIIFIRANEDEEFKEAASAPNIKLVKVFTWDIIYTALGDPIRRFFYTLGAK